MIAGDESIDGSDDDYVDDDDDDDDKADGTYDDIDGGDYMDDDDDDDDIGWMCKNFHYPRS